MDFDNLLREMETLNKNIELARSSLNDEVEKSDITQQKLLETDIEINEHTNALKSLKSQRRALEQELHTSKRNIEAISDRLGKMMVTANELKQQMTAGICQLADQHIGQRDGVYSLTDQIAVVRIKVNGKTITRLAPVCSRARPE